MLSPDDVPYGAEVFVIVPKEHAAAIRSSKARLMSSLASEFPGFTFSLGTTASGGAEEFMVMPVSGTVGDGWQKARPLFRLDGVDQVAIVEHLRRFVAGDVARPN